MDSNDPLADPRITLMGLLVEAYAEIMREVTAQERAHGVSVAEFDVLLRLGRSPNRQSRITDLCVQTGLTSGGMTRLIDRLDERGLVERGTDRADRRVVFAKLTDAGVAKTTDVLPGHLDILQRVLVDPLTGSERKSFERTLRKIRDNLSKPGTKLVFSPR
ncbi:MarR family winged helix-turn-helix transcriptional regulator [Nocardia terpenica]|uniref:MarR family transcriptional regulator n=1 Tax=Nocardia terpenica TaxID=455432 RepID=A0A291RIC8_9NOCA|nr:MarR family winged helix-turn-helix transcriptional regulator [Nocardia terpenica]ATL67343.1 MarR family transcriptional regulator [Nocardia terpenica]